MLGKRLTNNLKKIYSWTGYAVVILCLYFTGRQLFQQWPEFKELLTHRWVSMSLLVGSFCYSSILVLMAWAWHLLIKSLSGVTSFRTSYFIYTRTSVAKYLPGNVGHFVGRQLVARYWGLPQSTVAMGTVLEMLCQLAAGLLVSFWVDLPMRSIFPSWVIGLASLTSLAIAPFVVLWVSKYMNWQLRETIRYSSLWGTIMIACLLSLVFFILTGLIVIWLTNIISQGAIGGTSLVAVYAVAWFLGTITPGAPAGIGVREAVIMGMLEPSIGADSALAVALLFRCITTFGDVIFFASSYLVFSKKEWTDIKKENK